MSVELIGVLIAVLAIGATLAGLILTSNHGLRQDMAQLRQDERISGLESQISELRERMTHEVGELRERMARHEWCPRLLPFPVRPEPALPAEV